MYLIKQNLEKLTGAYKSMWRKCFLLSLLVILSIVPSNNLNAQEIDFGSYYNYSVSVAQLNPLEDLEFGLVVDNEGLKSVPITNALIVTVEGVKYLDIILDITADDYLLLNGDLGCQSDPTCRIPFTLEAAYANRGVNSTDQAIQMNVSSNFASAQFPILKRTNGPAGPPPTPVFDGYNPALFNETAYLYIYGSINVGDVVGGSYSSTITITVSYD